LAGLRPLTERALRVFAALALPPVFDDRAISAPKGQQGHLIWPKLNSGRGRTGQNRCPFDFFSTSSANMGCTDTSNVQRTSKADTYPEGQQSPKGIAGPPTASVRRLLPRRGPPDGIFVNPFEQGEIGPDLFRAACDMGLEGLVSKRSDRPYRGDRSPHWIKVKNRQHHAFDRVRESFPCRSGSASTPRKRSPTRIT
jgi:hypothetical protein